MKPMVTEPCEEKTARPPAPTRAGRWALAGLALSVLLSSLGTSIVNVALPALASSFDASFQAVQWIILAYLLALTTLVIAVGRLADIVGRRRLLLAGIALFTVAALLCGNAPTLPLLIAARALQGLGAAIMMALAIAFIGEVVPKERTGRAMGLLGTMSAAGTALGPSLGGILIGGMGWPAIFFINVPLGIVTLLLARRHLPHDPQPLTRNRPRFDTAGTVVLALTLATYALAMTLGRSRFGTPNLALLTAATLGVALFVQLEARAPAPLLRVEILLDRTLGGGLAQSLLVSTVMMATLVVGPFYLSRALGFSTALVGIIMSVGPVVSALAGLPSGRAVDRYGAHRVSVAGLTGLASGFFLLSAIPASAGIAGYLFPTAVLTAGYAMFQAANNTAVMTHVRSDQRNVVSGLLALARNLGLITGAAALGAVFALGSGTSDLSAAPPGAVAGGMRITFATAASLGLMALALANLNRTAALRSPAQSPVLDPLKHR